MHDLYKDGDTKLIMHCVVTTILAKEPTAIYILPGKIYGNTYAPTNHNLGLPQVD